LRCVKETQAKFFPAFLCADFPFDFGCGGRGAKALPGRTFPLALHGCPFCWARPNGLDPRGWKKSAPPQIGGVSLRGTAGRKAADKRREIGIHNPPQRSFTKEEGVWGAIKPPISTGDVWTPPRPPKAGTSPRQCAMIGVCPGRRPPQSRANRKRDRGTASQCSPPKRGEPLWPIQTLARAPIGP
jgi:hypothetical protein